MGLHRRHAEWKLPTKLKTERKAFKSPVKESCLKVLECGKSTHYIMEYTEYQWFQQDKVIPAFIHAVSDLFVRLIVLISYSVTTQTSSCRHVQERWQQDLFAPYYVTALSISIGHHSLILHFFSMFREAAHMFTLPHFKSVHAKSPICLKNTNCLSHDCLATDSLWYWRYW